MKGGDPVAKQIQVQVKKQPKGPKQPIDKRSPSGKEHAN